MLARYASRVCREARLGPSLSLKLVDNQNAAAVPLAAPLIETIASDFRFPPSSSLRFHFGCYPYFFCQRVSILDKELFPCSDFGGCHFHPCILDSGFVIGSDTLLCSDTLPYYARIPSSTDRVVITPSVLCLGLTPFGIPSFLIGSFFPWIPSVLV
jgi:hypothetical protein